jgi:hypothetical protein
MIEITDEMVERAADELEEMAKDANPEHSFEDFARAALEAAMEVKWE